MEEQTYAAKGSAFNNMHYREAAIGNDEQVVPMHGANKVIDFTTVDENEYNLQGQKLNAD